ncbi:MAG TPA: hypothetical protein VFW98_01735 [Gemmatimonadaceae bacterium]|nr:hypothetical protein [Gemmatimonadaceae bacterium]
MDGETRRALRFLKAYAFAATTLLVVVCLAAFRQAHSIPHFQQIDVERINVVEKDGTPRLVISNRARLPDLVIGGKVYPLRGGNGVNAAGMIFYNDEGNEDGGLVFSGKRTAQGHSASAGLTFDQYNQDETVTLSYADANGKRRAGLLISDRAAVSIQGFADSVMAIRSLPDGAEKTRRLQQLKSNAVALGGTGTPRLYAGKDANKAAIVMLSDPQGRPRLRLTVDSLGAPRIDFLDAQQHVVYSLPDSAHSAR